MTTRCAPRFASYSKTNTYIAEHFADAVCACGGRAFALQVDDAAGAAVRTCATCKLRHPIGDSAEYLDGRDLLPAGSAAEGRRGSIDGRDLLPAGSAAEGRRGSIDGRDLLPAGSAAEGRRGSIDGRDLLPAGSAAEGRRGSIDDAELDECACPCGGEIFEITAGVALYADSEDVRWIYLGCRCVACKLAAVYADWKNEYEGYRELLAKI